MGIQASPSGLNGAKRKRGRPKKQAGVLAFVDMGNGTWLVIFANEKGELVSLLDPHGLEATPAAVGLEGGDSTKPIFGHVATRYEVLHPEWVCTMAKRARGTDFVAIIDKGGREWMASELESMFLKWRLGPINERYGLTVAGVVVTVPANFADYQRRGTGDIVQAAGYELLRILNEPSAGIIAAAYGKAGLYLIFDLGQGTLDVSIVRVSEGRIFDLLATAGRDDLGGAEFASTLVEHCLEVLSKRGVALDPVKDAQSLVLLRQDCEAAKCDLSSMERVTVVVRAGSEIMDIEITRDLAESLWQGILDQCTQVLHESLTSAGLTPADIHGAIPGGGASRALCVQNLLVGMFTSERVIQVPDPQKLIVQGAACLARPLWRSVFPPGFPRWKAW